MTILLKGVSVTVVCLVGGDSSPSLKLQHLGIERGDDVNKSTCKTITGVTCKWCREFNVILEDVDIH